MGINEKSAELIGVILGDGHIHTKSNLITITGSLEDLEYYQNRVTPLFESLFSQTPKLKRRRDRNSYYLMICSKEIFNFFVNSVGLRRGSKKNASIPKAIYSDKKFMIAFLRGLFDTDGCIKFSKQSKNINYYPRIQIALRKSPMAYELGELFGRLGIKFGKWEEQRFSGIVFYQISGRTNANKWFKEISPQNVVHITKYDFWKKFGHYIPKSSLELRKNKLTERNN